MSAQLPPEALEKGIPAAKAGGWVKWPLGSVLGGGEIGTCFEPTLLREGGKLRMWFSWRPRKLVALVEGEDGVHWSDPVICLEARPESGWEDDLNRQIVVQREDGYHMWYTGQISGRSEIGYARSADGATWKRHGDRPVLSPDQAWETANVMCPHVIWDEEAGLFRMWYSGGEQYEPDAIGYATSPDGITWSKHPENPIFSSDESLPWEQHKVTACQVLKHRGWHVMFYIGFRDVDHAQVGVARSRDGITGWKRNPSNPIISPTEGSWDHDACYKPFALYDEPSDVWRLWYNGRRDEPEGIGMAFHVGEDLGF